MPRHDEHAEAAALEHAQDALIADCTGVLSFSEHSIPIRYVIDNETGRLISSLPVAALLATEHILFVPEETDDALQLMLTPEEIPESLATDRYLAYHGDPEHIKWAACWIDSAKHGPWVFDGEALMRPNPLAADEPALCKLLNGDDAKLAALAQRHAGLVVPSPVCVGVDPNGMHVRARFGVVRVRFEREVENGAEARELIGKMLEGGWEAH